MTFSWLTVTQELIGTIGTLVLVGMKANSTAARAQSGDLGAVCVNWA